MRSQSRRPGRERAAESSAALARMVEAEIIPRLMLAHRTGKEARAAAQTTARTGGPVADRAGVEPPCPREVAAFADLTVHGDVRQLSRCVDGWRDRGLDLEVILLELLAPAARLLGERWLSDEATFADVTIGLTRLHRLLHEVTDLHGDIAPAPGAYRALLVPAAGEQHTFGLVMVEAFLRHAGWEVWQGTAEEAATLVRQRRFDVVGISASGAAHLDAVALLVGEVRRASCNAEVAVLVGGPLFVEHPEHAATVGADAAARDAREACQVAQRLVAEPRGGVRAAGGRTLRLLDAQRRRPVAVGA